MQVNSIPIDKPTDWCYCVYPDNLLFTEKGTYDPRCRSWYMDPVQRIKRGDQAKVIQNDPYESAAGGGVFVTYTRHTQVTPENKDAVVAIDINPNEPGYYFNRANTKDESGDHLGAIEDYSHAIKLKQNDAEFYYGRAAARSSLNSCWIAP